MAHVDEVKSGGTAYLEYPESHDAMPRKRTTKEYLASRWTELKPPLVMPPNPISLMRLLNGRQWNFFLVAFAGWTWDAFDFFTVSLTTTQLAKEFGKSITDITWGMTLVLMLRSVGAITFGLLSDRYGRKWPFVIVNMMFIVIELATGFCKTYEQFLGCRALFGIAMGGLYGNCVATALEDCPLRARGIMSGFLQMGYVVGYLFATVFARALVDTTSHGWRPLFWFGACPPVLIIIWRLCLTETETYLKRERVKKANKQVVGGFFKEIKDSFKTHWMLLLYLFLILAGLQFQAHGTQDLYPTLLRVQFGFNANQVTITNSVANIGGFVGGLTCGWLSDVFGRRLTFIVTFFCTSALLYPYTFVETMSTTAAAFFLQFFLEGALGLIPIHMMELSPPSLRASAVGTMYQLGNLASSASITIEAKLGERFPLPSTTPGVKRYNYGLVICIFTACCMVYNIIVVYLGPENRGASFDVEDDPRMKQLVGEEGVQKAV